MTDAWFDAPVCRNCGAPLTTPFCGQCGQKRATRFTWRDLGKESWDRLRFFEFKSVHTLGRLVTAPGTVAREYVLGRRTAHMHPLTLLLALVALLVVELATNRYFGRFAGGRDVRVDAMAERVLAWANWSFSIGIVAIFATSLAVFRRRLDTNALEHAVLAIYVQGLILGVIIVNLWPTLIWRDYAFLLWHKQVSQYGVPAIKVLIVVAAFRQFFLLDWRRDWARLLAAAVLFTGINWLLLRVYAAAILWLVR